jgi:hypothetical protein
MQGKTLPLPSLVGREKYVSDDLYSFPLYDILKKFLINDRR